MLADVTRWFYEGATLQAFDKRSTNQELMALIDKRSIDELHDQATDALQQMTYRATSGDELAIKRLAMTAVGLVHN